MSKVLEAARESLTPSQMNSVEPVRQQQTDMSNPFSSLEAFELAQRMATALSKSTMVPKEYTGSANIPNCMIALELAQRLRGSVLMVMQNLYVVHGKPGWSSQYIIAAINSCGRFSTLDFEFSEDMQECRAVATDLKTGKERRGTLITIEMAKTEGWYGKSGSKWKTMPEQMLRYRAASFFGKAYCPEILMGFQTAEELEDIVETKKQTKDVQSVVIEERSVEPGVVIIPKPSEPERLITQQEEVPSVELKEERQAEAAAIIQQNNSNEVPWAKWREQDPMMVK